MKTLQKILFIFSFIAISFQLSAQVRTISSATMHQNSQYQKTASVILVSFDNSNNAVADAFTDLVQNAGNRYSKCFQGYNRSILLKKRWNGSNQPSVHITSNLKNEFFNQIKLLESQGYLIDIFIFAHGYSSGTISTDFGNISKSDIENRLGDKCYPIRLVYQMNCYGSKLNSAFRGVGARTVVGAKYVNFYPNQFNKFMDQWNANQTLATALANSNTTSSRTAAQTYIVAHSNTKFNFRKCIPGSTVLGTRPCAASYFDNNWGMDGVEFNTNLSGKNNMNNSSRMIVAGSGSIRKTHKTHSGCSGSGGTNPPTSITPITILNTTGNVLSARRAKKVTLKASRTSKATVKVQKTDGKARTTVTVYALQSNGSETYKASYEFKNSNNKWSKTLTINGVKNKKLVVYLRNHSVTNQFKYRLTVKEKN